MAKPLKHALHSKQKYGGEIEDYLEIHTFFDSTKSAHPDIRHRAILHNAFGIFLIEKVFGAYITNSDGNLVATRDIAEDHVMQDMGTIPTLEDWLKEMPIKDWMQGHKQTKNKKEFTYD